MYYFQCQSRKPGWTYIEPHITEQIQFNQEFPLLRNREEITPLQTAIISALYKSFLLYIKGTDSLFIGELISNWSLPFTTTIRKMNNVKRIAWSLYSTKTGKADKAAPGYGRVLIEGHWSGSKNSHVEMNSSLNVMK